MEDHHQFMGYLPADMAQEASEVLEATRLALRQERERVEIAERALEELRAVNLMVQKTNAQLEADAEDLRAANGLLEVEVERLRWSFQHMLRHMADQVQGLDAKLAETEAQLANAMETIDRTVARDSDEAPMDPEVMEWVKGLTESTRFFYGVVGGMIAWCNERGAPPSFTDHVVQRFEQLAKFAREVPPWER